MAVTNLALLLIATVALVSGSPAVNSVDSGHTPEALYEAVDKFAVKFHKATVESVGHKNVVTSPLAIQLLLSLYATGTGGPLREELVQALHLGDFDKIVPNFAHISNQLSNFSPDTLTLANRIYTAPSNDQFPLVPSFDNNAQAYGYEVQHLNFQDTSKAVEIINQWVSQQSYNNIKDAVSASDIAKDTVLALLNVIYFKGQWNVPFKAADTKDDDFYVDINNTIKKPFMNLKHEFKYAHDSDIGARLLELPYREVDFRMVVVLPDAIEGLQSVIDKLAQKGLRPSLQKMRPYPADIIVKMPKFEIESKLELNTLLPKVGISKLFTEETSGILKGGGIKVGQALQKAFVKVDEEGATAGAFTGSFAIPISANYELPPTINYHVDHPFFFAILHDETIVFTGTYAL